MAVLLKDKAIGSIVKIKIDNQPVDFIVAHQGRPTDKYNISWLNGTVLLMRYAYAMVMSNSNGFPAAPYGSSYLHEYMQKIFKPKIDPSLSSRFLPGPPSPTSTQPFLLSTSEFGASKTHDGYALSDTWGSGLLSYFLYGDDAASLSKRVATTIDGYAVMWWTRNNTSSALPMPYFVFHDGSVRDYNGPQQPYIRPAMTLPNSLYVSDDGYVTTNQAPTAPGSITYGTPRAAKPLDLTLTAATDPD